MPSCPGSVTSIQTTFGGGVCECQRSRGCHPKWEVSCAPKLFCGAQGPRPPCPTGLGHKSHESVLRVPHWIVGVAQGPQKNLKKVCWDAHGGDRATREGRCSPKQAAPISFKLGCSQRLSVLRNSHFLSIVCEDERIGENGFFSQNSV